MQIPVPLSLSPLPLLFRSCLSFSLVRRPPPVDWLFEFLIVRQTALGLAGDWKHVYSEIEKGY